MKKEDILNKLKELKPIYINEGLEILWVCGSYAKDKNIKYIGGFSKLLNILKNEVDFVLDSKKLFLL